MKTSHSLFYLFFVIILSSCADADNSSVQLGKWLATQVDRRDCSNELLNGPANCINDVGGAKTFSCVELTLYEAGYILKITFDAETTNETGTYESSSGNIRLCPTEPVGVCYDLPIITADFDTMTIDIPRNNGCIATIPMIKT